MCNIEGCGCANIIKIVCCKIHYNNRNFAVDLTVGRIYDAIDWNTQLHTKDYDHRQEYNLVDNFGFRKNISKDYFKLLSEVRNDRIDEIFND